MLKVENERKAKYIIWLCLINIIEDFTYQVTRASCFNLVLTLFSL